MRCSRRQWPHLPLRCRLVIRAIVAAELCRWAANQRWCISVNKKSKYTNPPMDSAEWQSFLFEFSHALLEFDERSYQRYGHYQIPEQYYQKGYMGFPGATEEQILQAEARLGGIRLPTSYRTFLKVSNGWGEMGGACPGKIWSTEEIDWLKVRSQHLIESLGRYQHEAAPQEHLAKRESSVFYRGAYMNNALEISGWGDASILFLSPEVVTEAGEWECWQLASWYPGANRHVSFEEWMRESYRSLKYRAQSL